MVLSLFPAWSMAAGAEAELNAGNYSTVGSADALRYTDAGSYTVYYYVVSSNYAPDAVSGYKTVSIEKADAPALTDAQKPTANTGLIADGTEQALVTAPAALPEGYTALQYSLDGGSTWLDTLPTGVGADDYSVTVQAPTAPGSSTSSPATGDESSAALWFALLLFSGAGLAATFSAGKRRARR